MYPVKEIRMGERCRGSVLVKAGDINSFKIRFQSIRIFETSHSLHHVEIEIVVDLYIKITNLVEKDIEVFVSPFCNKNPVVYQGPSLLSFV